MHFTDQRGSTQSFFLLQNGVEILHCVLDDPGRGATGATAEAQRRRVHAEVKLRYIGICRFAAHRTSAPLGCKRSGAERMDGAEL
jgi:hypothetical protein